jgi:hypothetical protein
LRPLSGSLGIGLNCPRTWAYRPAEDSYLALGWRSQERRRMDFIEAFLNLDETP